MFSCILVVVPSGTPLYLQLLQQPLAYENLYFSESVCPCAFVVVQMLQAARRPVNNGSIIKELLTSERVQRSNVTFSSVSYHFRSEATTSWLGF